MEEEAFLPVPSPCFPGFTNLTLIYQFPLFPQRHIQKSPIK